MSIPLGAYWSLLIDYLRPQWGRVVLLALILLASIGLELYGPQILRTFINEITGGVSPHRLTYLAAIFIAVAFANNAISAYSRYLGEDVGWTATNHLRADVAAHCLSLDMAFHKVHRPGELVERIDGDVDTLGGFFSRLIVHLGANAILVLGVLVLLFLEDWRLGTALAAYAVVALVVLVKIRNIAVPYFRAVRQQSATFFGFLEEHLSGREDIRANGATGFVMRRFYQIATEWLRRDKQAALRGSAMWSTAVVLFALGDALAFAMGFYLWHQGVIAIGTVYLIFHYTDLLKRPLGQIRTQLQELQRASASILRIRELLDTETRLPDGRITYLPAGPLSVRLDGVSFAYEDDDEVILHDINLDLSPGRVIGLLGRTGSGKTSLARLLLRLYDPTEGEVVIGGTAARQLAAGCLRQRVQMVTQDVQVFHATVRDNLTFFAGGVDDRAIVAVLEELGLGNWVRGLPAGLDTVLESGGGGLSAGEGQLLAFARIFLADPGLVVLDEASSRIDPATEQLIEGAIDRLLAGRTGVVIAHRLATIDRADDILILEGGRVVEFGEREALAADPGSRFAQLLKTGMEGFLA